MPTYRFEEIKWPASKRVPCAGGCGKKLTRSTTFSQTLNPFNKNSEGAIKTRREIWSELKREADEWVAAPMGATCKKCEPPTEGDAS